jgi:deoxycytidine triphosphate deaminase
MLSHHEILGLLSTGRIKIISTISHLPFKAQDQVEDDSIILRLGKIDLSKGDNKSSISLAPDDVRREGLIPLGAHEIMLASTMEAITFPDDVGGVAVHIIRPEIQEFVKIIPYEEFIIPGFTGTIPLQIINLTERIICLKSFDRICKLTLFKTAQTVTREKNGPDESYIVQGVDDSHFDFGILANSQSAAEAYQKWDEKRRIVQRQHSKKQLLRGKKNISELEKFIIQSYSKHSAKTQISSEYFKISWIFNVIRERLPTSEEKIKLLDVSYSKATWLKHFVSFIGKQVSQVGYYGVERGFEDKNHVNRNALRQKFTGYKCVVAEPHQLKGIPSKYDIVWMSNCIYKLEPDSLYHVFSGMNYLLQERTGKIVITDLKEIPDEEHRAKNIWWSPEEVMEMLIAAGFLPNVVNPKQSNLFQITVPHSKAVKEEPMLKTIRKILIEKRTFMEKFSQNLEANWKESTPFRIERAKCDQLNSRIAWVIISINDRLKELGAKSDAII